MRTAIFLVALGIIFGLDDKSLTAGGDKEFLLNFFATLFLIFAGMDICEFWKNMFD